jgi:peptidoglycan/xylan/chitin deacetylase (PgdA/CDA1 family)
VRLPRDRLALGYHAISETWPAALSIEPGRLEAQLVAVLERGYSGATFTDLVTGRCARPAVAVTFDDGFRSVIERALPILSKFGLIGTAFIATDWIDRAGPLGWPSLDQWFATPHEDELDAMSWDDLERLAVAGWEIGSHTLSHPRLVELNDEQLMWELVESRRVCEERLGSPCRSLAFPYGAVDRRVMVATRRAGYLAAAALPPRIHRLHRYCWPRVGIWHNDPAAMFEVKLSPRQRRRVDFRTGEWKWRRQWRFGKP